MKLRLAFVALTVCVAVAGCSRPPTELRLLAPPLLAEREIAENLIRLFGEDSPVELTLVPVPDDADSVLDALENGHGDLAFASNTQPFRKNVFTVIPLYPSVLHIIYRADRDASNNRSLLEGASIFAGPPGSASRQLLDKVLDDLKVDPEDVSFVDNVDTRPDVIVIYAPISPKRVKAYMEETAGAIRYKLLSFGSPADIGTGSLIDRAVLLNPQLTPFVIPAGTYGELNPEPVVTLAVDKLLVARSDLPAAVIYDLIGEILRLRPALAAQRPGLFTRLDGNVDDMASTFIVHPGAQDYTQREEPSFIERYSGIAEVVVTILIGLVSGSFAVMKIYRIRRKNRIDVFYSDAMAVRESVGDATDAATRREAKAKLQALRKTAFQQLIDEKLAADDSFRIFITLCNDIVAEIDAQPVEIGTQPVEIGTQPVEIDAQPVDRSSVSPHAAR